MKELSCVGGCGSQIFMQLPKICVCVYLFEKDELHLNLGVLSLLRRAELFYERDNDVIERQELYVCSCVKLSDEGVGGWGCGLTATQT